MQPRKVFKNVAIALGALALAVSVFLAGTYLWLRHEADRKMEELLAGVIQEVAISSETTQLGAEPTRFVPEARLNVIGLQNEVCVLVARDVANEDDVDAQLRRETGGAHVRAVLHASDGKSYQWTDGSWVFPWTEEDGERGDLYSCLTTSDARNELPPKGTHFTAVELRADRPLRIHGVTWRSSSSQDHFLQPPPDVEVKASAEYEALEADFGSEASWGAPARLMLQVELARRFPREGYPESDFNSSLSLRLGDDALQLQPREGTIGLDALTIPASAVQGCAATGGFRDHRSTELYLHRQGIRVSFLDAPEVVEWCWRNRIRLLSCRERSSWYYKQAPLVALAPDDVRFASIESYYRSAACNDPIATNAGPALVPPGDS